MPATKPRNPRRGLQRLECECGDSLYRTWSQVETRSLPLCGECGAPFIPDHPDLAAAILPAADLEQHPAVIAYKRAVASVMHGQAGPARSLRGRGGRHFTPPEQIASERLESERREAAHARRVEHLRRGNRNPDAPATADAIPF